MEILWFIVVMFWVASLLICGSICYRRGRRDMWEKVIRILKDGKSKAKPGNRPWSPPDLNRMGRRGGGRL